MAIAAALTAGLPGAAFSSEAAGGADQVVSGTVMAQFGVSVGPDGSVGPSASTIPVSVTHTVENGVEIITIAPLR